MVTDADLIKRTQSGDSRSFGKLVEEYREEVYLIALGISGDPTEAEDLTQEIFIKVYLNLWQLRNPEKFSSWLRSIAQNHCRDWLRTHAEQYLPIQDLPLEDQLILPSADEEILNEDFGRALASALASLKAEDRQILRLFYAYRFGYKEITRARGISYSAATSRLHKAKKRIRALMDGFAVPSEPKTAMMTLSGGTKAMKLGLSEDILGGIKAVEYAQNIEDEKRHFLSGVCMEYTREDGFRMIATDGRRLAVAQLPGDGGDEDMSIVISTEELSILKESLASICADVTVDKIDNNLAAFYMGDEKKLVKLIPSQFPDYRGVLFYPEGYSNSITIERRAAMKLMEEIIKASEGKCASDWIQWGDTIYILHASDVLQTPAAMEQSMELHHKILGFIAESASPKELFEKIFSYLPREEYHRLHEAIEKRKAPPSDPVGTLKALDSEGDVKFAGRCDSNFLLDAFRSMTGDAVKIRYRLEKDMQVTRHPLRLEDDTSNIHLLMPMR